MHDKKPEGKKKKTDKFGYIKTKLLQRERHKYLYTKLKSNSMNKISTTNITNKMVIPNINKKNINNPINCDIVNRQISEGIRGVIKKIW